MQDTGERGSLREPPLISLKETAHWLKISPADPQRGVRPSCSRVHKLRLDAGADRGWVDTTRTLAGHRRYRARQAPRDLAAQRWISPS